VQTARENKGAAELALQRVLSAETDSVEARHLLAAVHGEAMSTPNQGFAREAFDRIAPQFDNHQLRLHDYRVPAEIVALIESYEPARGAVVSVADLGCGTGLVASALRDAFAVERATGIDISPAMIELAREKDLYDELILADAVNGLALLKGPFELLTAADLFPYLGNLSAFMTAARAQLAPGGLLAYSIEVLNGDGISLAATGRFRHAPAYVEEVARSAGLRAVASRAVTLRRSLGQDVPGLVGLLQA
jgi:predicted TPR repeat methyltransferase